MGGDVHLARTDVGLHLASLVGHVLRHRDHDWRGVASVASVPVLVAVALPALDAVLEVVQHVVQLVVPRVVTETVAHNAVTLDLCNI